MILYVKDFILRKLFYFSNCEFFIYNIDENFFYLTFSVSNKLMQKNLQSLKMS